MATPIPPQKEEKKQREKEKDKSLCMLPSARGSFPNRVFSRDFSTASIDLSSAGVCVWYQSYLSSCIWAEWAIAAASAGEGPGPHGRGGCGRG